jgi:hypothetical protein
MGRPMGFSARMGQFRNRKIRRSVGFNHPPKVFTNFFMNKDIICNDAESPSELGSAIGIVFLIILVITFISLLFIKGGLFFILLGLLILLMFIGN